jgi:O-antigen/teichoic acid export membrane protein
MPPPRVPISKRLVLINATSQIATRVLYITVIVWTIQYLVKRIPPEQYALLPMMLALLLVIPMVQSVLAGGLSRYVTEAYAKDDEQRVTQLTSTMFPIMLLGGILVAVAGFVVAWQAEWILVLEPEQVPDVRLMLALLTLSAAISLPLAPFSVGLIVRQRFVLQNVLQLASTALRVVLLLVLLLGIGPHVKWVVLSQVAGNLSLTVAKMIASRRLMPALRFRTTHINWPLAREMFSYNGWNSLMGISILIRDSADPFLLNWLATPVAVAAFDLGALVDRELRRMSSFGSQPMQPALTAMHAQDRMDRLGNAFLRGGRVGLWAILAPSILLAVFRNEIYQIYLGERFTLYSECTVVVALLLATYPSYYARWMLHKIGAARAQLRLIAVLTLVMNTFNLGLTCFLVGVLDWGAIGSAAGTLISSVVFDIAVFWPLSVWLLELPWRRFLSADLLPGIAPAIVTGVACELLRRWIEPDGLVALGLCLAAGAAVYLFVLFTFCLLTVDRQDLARIFGSLGLKRNRKAA